MRMKFPVIRYFSNVKDNIIIRFVYEQLSKSFGYPGFEIICHNYLLILTKDFTRKGEKT